jgi:sialic acid synthase SpsE
MKFLNKKNIFGLKSPYFIAEVGVNHNCSISLAKKQILLAKKNGAHAVKFQSYKAERITSVNSPSYWDRKFEKTANQFELFKKYDMFDFDDYKKLSIFCKKINIDFASTPFDTEAVKYLNPLMKFFKIASADLNNTPLLRAIGQTKKPVILSTGASNIKEINTSINILKKSGAKNIVILHCILNYPTLDYNANLEMITDLKNKFKNYILGYSDHTLPDQKMLNLTLAYLKGARVIEKHFTHNKSIKGNDHFHSCDGTDLNIFFNNIKKINELSGLGQKKCIQSEKISRLNARRSIVVNADVKKNQIITVKNVTTKRPGTGITADNWDKVLGKKFKKNLKYDYILKWRDIKN